jgi:hypothetical protein
MQDISRRFRPRGRHRRKRIASKSLDPGRGRSDLRWRFTATPAGVGIALYAALPGVSAVRPRPPANFCDACRRHQFVKPADELLVAIAVAVGLWVKRLARHTASPLLRRIGRFQLGGIAFFVGRWLVEFLLEFDEGFAGFEGLALEGWVVEWVADGAEEGVAHAA